MSTELIPADQKEALANVEKIVDTYGLMALEGSEGAMDRTLMISQGMTQLKKALTNKVMEPIVAMQNTALGFKTDKMEGYDIDTIRNVACEAFLRGFRMVGNEVNIIAGNFYAAKEGCKRRVLEWPGLTEFNLELACPKDNAGTSRVEALATWKLNGAPDQLERRGKMAIPIRRNAGMIDDAILGKAERKMYAAVLNRLSTFAMPDGEVEDDPNVINAESKPVRSSLNDFADEVAPTDEVPTFDLEDQARLVEDFRARFSKVTNTKDVGPIQKEAAQMAGAGQLSPESLTEINKVANQTRSALK